jgi:hypothetical protein
MLRHITDQKNYESVVGAANHKNGMDRITRTANPLISVSDQVGCTPPSGRVRSAAVGPDCFGLLARQQARESGVEMVVVRDDLSEDARGYECCAAMYVSTLYSEQHCDFWEIVGRVPAP